MDSLLNRYRNITVLLVVIFAQLVLLAYQVKNEQDIPVIRLWTVTAITPLARVIEGVRSGVAGALGDYVFLKDARDQNRTLKQEVAHYKLENQFLKNELSTADRAQALLKFQALSPSKTLPARVIGTAPSASSKVVFVDRGTSAGVMKGMAVVTPDGIVGKVLAAFPIASQVLLITDPSFAAGVISQKNHVHGTLKGLGHTTCRIDYVQNEQKVEVGEWFYSSGDDRVFPKGMPAGRVTGVRAGSPFQEIYVEPAAFRGGLEEVLIVLEAVHQVIPELQTAGTDIYMAPQPPGESQDSAPVPAPQGPGTDADRLREQYKRVGDAQGHVFGEGAPGSRPPDFNLKVPAGAATQPAAPGGPAANPDPAASGGAAAPRGATARPRVPAPQKPAAPANPPAARPREGSPGAPASTAPTTPASPSRVP
jgi:rod shape-determining protein MreC